MVNGNKIIQGVYQNGNVYHPNTNTNTNIKQIGKGGVQININGNQYVGNGGQNGPVNIVASNGLENKSTILVRKNHFWVFFMFLSRHVLCANFVGLYDYYSRLSDYSNILDIFMLLFYRDLRDFSVSS